MRNLQRSRSANGVSSLPIGTHPLADSRPFAVVSIKVQDNLMKRAARVRLLHGACVDEQKRVAVVTHRIRPGRGVTRSWQKVEKARKIEPNHKYKTAFIQNVYYH